MKTTIYLVRHGEVHNPKDVIYGRMPGFPLSENGRRQAQALGKYLSSRAIAAIYTSPLTRARETATIVSSFFANAPVIDEELLLEVYSPHLEGKPYRLADEMGWDFYTVKQYKLGQERKRDLWKRMRMAIEKIKRAHKGKSVVIVSHGDPIVMAVSRLLGKPFLPYRFDQAPFVQPAKGYELIFDEFGLPEASKIDF